MSYGDWVFWAIIVVGAVLLLPLITYLVVKLGTAGYYRGREAFREWWRARRDSNGRDGTEHFHF